MITHYFKIAVRNLLKYKTQNLICIIGVSIGILCYSVCSYYARSIGRGDTVYPMYEQMAQEHTIYKDYGRQGSPHNATLTQRIEAVIQNDVVYTARYSKAALTTTISKEDGKEVNIGIHGLLTNDQFIKVYPPTVVEGNIDNYLKQPNSIVVSEAFARQWFDKGAVIGKSLMIPIQGEMVPHTIVAVIKPYPLYTSISFSSVDFLVKNEMERNYINVYILHPRTDIEALNKRIAHLHEGIEGIGEDVKCVELHYQKETDKVDEDAIFIAIIGFLVMFSGLINFLTFRINFFFSRDREFHLRKVLGSKSGNLFFQLFTEIAITLGITFLLCLSLQELALPKLFNSLPPFVQSNLRISFEELRTYSWQDFLLITIFSALVCLITVLRINYRTKKGRNALKKPHGKQRIRNWMLGTQLFICIGFILATGAMYLTQEQSAKLMHGGQLTKKEREQILCVNISSIRPMLSPYWEEIQKKLEQKALFDMWCFTNWGSYLCNFGDEKTSVATIHTISPSYFQMMKIPLKTPLEAGKPCCILNKEAAKLLANENIHSVNRLHGRTKETTATYSIHDVVDLPEKLAWCEESLYVPQEDMSFDNSQHLYLRTKSNINIHQAQREIQALFNSYMPNPEQTWWKIQDLNNRNELQAQIMMYKLFMTCAFICISITVLGLFGAISIDTHHRRKEVAIRKINGAQNRQIYWLFGKLYFKIFLVASVLACTIAIGLFNFLSQKISFFDFKNPIYWLLTLSFTALIVLISIIGQIYQISKLNPLESIKGE